MNYLFTGPTIAFAAGDRVIMDYVRNPSYEPYPALSAQEYAKKLRPSWRSMTGKFSSPSLIY